MVENGAWSARPRGYDTLGAEAPPLGTEWAVPAHLGTRLASLIPPFEHS